MALPELIYAPLDGGTIHRYEISGGKRKLKVQAHAFTKVAKQKIEGAGGTCELISKK